MSHESFLVSGKALLFPGWIPGFIPGLSHYSHNIFAEHELEKYQLALYKEFHDHIVMKNVLHLYEFIQFK